MSSESPPGSKPMSAIPTHVLNGSSPLNSSSAGNRAARERESLNSSIRSSFSPRNPVEFESSNTGTQATGESSGTHIGRNEQEGTNPVVRTSGDAR